MLNSVILLLFVACVTQVAVCNEESSDGHNVDFLTLLRKLEMLENKNRMLEATMTQEITKLNKRIDELETTCDSGEIEETETSPKDATVKGLGKVNTKLDPLSLTISTLIYWFGRIISL